MVPPFARRADSTGVRAGRRALLAGLAAALAGGGPRWPTAHAASTPAVAPPGGTPRAPSRAATPSIHDRMIEFWPVYDATRSLASDQRGPRLLRDYFEIEAPIYRRAGIHDITADRVSRWLARFDPLAADVRRIHARLSEDYHVFSAKFQAVLPDFDPAATPVFVLPSLFQFDAHLEPDGRIAPMFFGPDGIVRYHGAWPELGVLFAHEIFHCYQAQKNPAMLLDPKPPIYADLWIEGVATWASERINPSASLLHVLLDDETLLREGPVTARSVAGALLHRIDATDPATMESFFSAGWRGADWPARAGYYVGFLAAREIGRELTLQQMAALPAPEARQRLADVLAGIRDGRVSSEALEWAEGSR